MAKKTWDVEDDRKLRRGLESTTDFANAAYHRVWATPGMGWTDGADSTLFQWRVYNLADAATEKCRFGFIVPENWKRGVIKYKWHLGATVGGGIPLDFRFTHRSRKYSFTDNPTGGPDLLDVTETHTHEDGAGVTSWDIYEPTGWDTRIDLDTYTGITAELKRLGADGADTSTAVLSVVGLELIFYPDARP